MSDVKMVQGIDLWGNNFIGALVNVVGSAKVAIIKTGEDRLDVTQAELCNLKEVDK
jgi:hypothetical protein